MLPGLRLSRFLLAASCLVAPGFAFAQTDIAAVTEAPATPAAPAANPLAQAGGGGALPFNVEADNSLEWHQDERVYIAKGNAKVTRGDFSVTGDTLTAYDRDQKTPTGATSNEIYKFMANGHVVVSNGKAKAYGDHATYEVDTQNAVMTGGDLRLISDKDTVTAKDSFTYDGTKRMATARGDAVATRPTENGKRTIKADVLTVYFVEDANKQLVADHMEATGNVRVLTETDIVTGTHATYDLKNEKALIDGNVKISRGKSQLEGDRAEIDIKSGVSRLLTEPSAVIKKRVRGLLMPNDNSAKKGGAQ